MMCAGLMCDGVDRRGAGRAGGQAGGELGVIELDADDERRRRHLPRRHS